MKNAKCTNCGANIEVDEQKEKGICKYCNAEYVTEKAIQNVGVSATNNANTIVNNYYTASAQPQQNVNTVVSRVVVAEPRPKLKVGLAVLLCWLYIIPGVVYICLVKSKQKEWDRMYGNK